MVAWNGKFSRVSRNILKFLSNPLCSSKPSLLTLALQKVHRTTELSFPPSCVWRHCSFMVVCFSPQKLKMHWGVWGLNLPRSSRTPPLWGIKCSLPMLKAYRYAYILWQNMVWWSFGQQRHNITPVPLLREVKSWLVWRAARSSPLPLCPQSHMSPLHQGDKLR